MIKQALKIQGQGARNTGISIAFRALLLHLLVNPYVDNSKLIGPHLDANRAFLFSVHIFVFSEWDVSNGGFNITPRGAPEILTISFTRVFSLALNAVQFTFEIRCRGEQNVTRHVAVVLLLLLLLLFQCSLFTAMESQNKSMLVKKEMFLDFFLPLLFGDENTILFRYSKHIF